MEYSRRRQMAKRDTRIQLIAGGIGGMTGVMVTCPLEVVKTRLQAAHNKEILNANRPQFGMRVFSSLRSVAQTEGVTGLWKGLGPNLVGVTPARAIWFATYNKAKNVLEDRLETSNNSRVHFASAIVAGLTVATVTNPIWLVKTRMQLQTLQQENARQHNYKGSLDCVRRVYREEGFRGFYKGLTASYVGISESSLQMVLYELIRASVQRRKLANKEVGGVELGAVELLPTEQLLVGSSAKLIAAAATYPHEVVRTRLREQRGGTPKYTNVLQALRLVGKEEGAAGLYGGLAPHLVRVVPNAAIMFFVYESIVGFFARRMA